MSPAPHSVNPTPMMAEVAEGVEVKSEEEARVPRVEDKVELTKAEREKIEMLAPYTSPIVWKNVIGFVILHAFGLWAIPKLLISTKFATQLFALFLGLVSAEGVLIGAHRLYSHKSFKATWQLRLLVTALHTIAGQNCMYIWVRDHRLHHKYSDTNADPHNARRGFWFSHVGWLNMRKHPLVIEKGKGIDLSDLEQDQILMFQKKWYKPLYFLLALALPVAIPVMLWNESWWDSLLCVYFLRYCMVLNLTWTVNSAAHLWGTRPYDNNLLPAENLYVGFWGLGEGWHNFHHAFPWDYRAAELGLHYSPTTYIIDYFYRKGWASNLKFATDDMIKRRIKRTGDGTHHDDHHIEEPEPEPEEYQDQPTTSPVINIAEEPKLTARHRG